MFAKIRKGHSFPLQPPNIDPLPTPVDPNSPASSYIPSILKNDYTE